MTRPDLVIGSNGAGKTSFVTSAPADAIIRCDVASCWDNSAYRGPDKVAAFTCGEPDRPPAWPAWTPEELAARWTASCP